jgi:hypothetical protein
MGRWGLGLLTAAAIVEAASAQDVSQSPRTDQAAAAQAHCAALGPGFFAVTGSTTCMRISGHVSAGAGFVATGANGRAPSSPVAGTFTEEGVSGDFRFDTPIGPGRVYVHVHSVNGSRWLSDAQ